MVLNSIYYDILVYTKYKQVYTGIHSSLGKSLRKSRGLSRGLSLRRRGDVAATSPLGLSLGLSESPGLGHTSIYYDKLVYK